METPPLNSAATIVMGVSRSGRVRKKSSKLLDFQSPDELEKKPKRSMAKPTRSAGRGRPSSGGRMLTRVFDEDTSEDVADDDDELFDELEEDEVDSHAEPPDSAQTAHDSDFELDELVADLVEGVEAESMEHANNNNESKVRQSLYMTEKSNKRKMLRDGKVVTGKMERKDKGKSRYTAYSMWARDSRKSSKFSKNQDLDFANTARRLSELWANVSNKEKISWRRKAKIQATKAKAREKTQVITATASNASSNASFLNRATTSRTRKLAADRQKSPTGNESPIEVAGSASKRRRYNSHKSMTTNGATAVLANADATNPSYLGANNLSAAAGRSSTAGQLGTNKGSKLSIGAIDSAAHLKLLGESLTIIGERLKEHEGQIAVSGSLSVLLDSLLCSLGPLLCLTTNIPGLEKKKQLSENLAATLDNIAYVMPGL